MKCHRPEFLSLRSAGKEYIPEKRPEFPETLVDCLTGQEIPFTNRDNIRQLTLKFLLEEKGYFKDDMVLDRDISFELEGQRVNSLVDISICIDNKTLMVWKCASGSLVTRERQIIASSRLLEDYIVPFAAVANGKDVELLDTSSGKVIGNGYDSVFSRIELLKIMTDIALRSAKGKKIINEQRILFTYDAISCAAGCRSDPGITSKVP